MSLRAPSKMIWTLLAGGVPASLLLAASWGSGGWLWPWQR
jgi:hypothetical protein